MTQLIPTIAGVSPTLRAEILSQRSQIALPASARNNAHRENMILMTTSYVHCAQVQKFSSVYLRPAPSVLLHKLIVGTVILENPALVKVPAKNARREDTPVQTKQSAFHALLGNGLMMWLQIVRRFAKRVSRESTLQKEVPTRWNIVYDVDLENT